MVCKCGDIVAGLSTSVDARGVNSVICATATDATPIGTVVPTGTHGDGENAAWQQVACDFGSLVEDDGMEQERWNDARATAAWEQLMTNWQAEGKPEDFSNYAVSALLATLTLLSAPMIVRGRPNLCYADT